MIPNIMSPDVLLPATDVFKTLANNFMKEEAKILATEAAKAGAKVATIQASKEVAKVTATTIIEEGIKSTTAVLAEKVAKEVLIQVSKETVIQVSKETAEVATATIIKEGAKIATAILTENVAKETVIQISKEAASVATTTIIKEGAKTATAALAENVAKETVIQVSKEAAAAAATTTIKEGVKTTTATLAQNVATKASQKVVTVASETAASQLVSTGSSYLTKIGPTAISGSLQSIFSVGTIIFSNDKPKAAVKALPSIAISLIPGIGIPASILLNVGSSLVIDGLYSICGWNAPEKCEIILEDTKKHLNSIFKLLTICAGGAGGPPPIDPWFIAELSSIEKRLKSIGTTTEAIQVKEIIEHSMDYIRLIVANLIIPLICYIRDSNRARDKKKKVLTDLSCLIKDLERLNAFNDGIRAKIAKELENIQFEVRFDISFDEAKALIKTELRRL